MKIPTISTNMDRPVNLLRATTTCNAFYMFLSAAKASLLPFLTLYFRLIGLTAWETGIVMAAKTLTAFVWAPLWARCAVAYNKRRVVLLFSLLMMGAMYMSFTAVYYKVAHLKTCQPDLLLDHQGGNVTSPQQFTNSHLNHANIESQNNNPGASVGQPDVQTPGSGSSSQGNRDEGDDKTGQETPAQATNVSEVGNGHHILPTPIETPPGSQEKKNNSVSTASVPHKTTASGGATEPMSTQKPPSAAYSLFKTQLQQKLKELGLSLNDFKSLVKNGELNISDIKEIIPDTAFTGEDLKKLLDETEDGLADSDSKYVTKRSAHRMPRNLNFTLLNNLKDGISALTVTLAEYNLLLFLIVLLIIMFGEFFSSPVEKIADDAWFDFLERIDDMEKYGRQRYWGSLTFALVPIVVTCIVDYTPCKMMLNLHHFLIHFFVFGIFVVFTLLIAFYFPMPPPVKHKYSSKVGKGLRMICCDVRGLLFVITLLVAGSVYASFYNFLFWHLQDLGSHEVTMGLCVSIGAFAETPMLVFSNKLVRKFGHGGVVSMSLLVLAFRLLYYGFLWTPWAVLPAEVTNAFTHTALWYAVLSYDEFNVGSAIDRSIRSVLSSVYFGLGFSVGSFVSGVVYHLYGASVLYWGASVLSGAWCLVYSLIQCCLPKKERVKYIKLLRKAEDDSSEGEDDWLEMALKDQ